MRRRLMAINQEKIILRIPYYQDTILNGGTVARVALVPVAEGKKYRVSLTMSYAMVEMYNQYYAAIDFRKMWHTKWTAQTQYVLYKGGYELMHAGQFIQNHEEFSFISMITGDLGFGLYAYDCDATVTITDLVFTEL